MPETLNLKCEIATSNPPVSLTIDRDKGKVIAINCKGMELRTINQEYPPKEHLCAYNGYQVNQHDCLFRDLPLRELEKFLKLLDWFGFGFRNSGLHRCGNCGDLTFFEIYPQKEKDLRMIEQIGLTIGKPFADKGLTLRYLLCGNCNSERESEIKKINERYGIPEL